MMGAQASRRRMISIAELGTRVEQALLADRWRLRRALREAERSQGAGRRCDERLSRIAEELERSIAHRQARRAGVPHVRYDDRLPVAARRGEIAQAIRSHQVVIVCGDTGSGKSTQLPKICLELGRGLEGFIGHTQPRRIAARSVAARIADELCTPLGQQVGFKVRFTDKTDPRTYIKLMTDGVLLAESHHDPYLNQYDTLILDEAHERSLNIDFLLGYLKRLLPRRPDLKLIVTSATIDARRFAEHFEPVAGDVLVIMVSGRTYPVEVRYRPPADDKEGDDAGGERALVSAVDELIAAGDGDILIFMPTEQEIHAAAKTLRGHLSGKSNKPTEILPLYARLSTAEQNRIFQPHADRRIVIATNVAESSLTVPGIAHVIDTGTARISRYAPRFKIQRLPIEPISRASADQRKGRCGRLGPGVCIRLYSEDDYLHREAYTPPEILRSDLAAVALQAEALRLGEVADFPFLDPPRGEAVSDAYRTLFELGAVDQERRLTEVGRQLSRLPVDPRIGRIILAGAQENCLHDVLIIAAALEVQDPRERPPEAREAADEAHARTTDGQSDFLSYLKLWRFFHELKAELSRNQLAKACRAQFLSYNRLRQWLDVHRQLVRHCTQAGFDVRPRPTDYQRIHRALLTGFLSSIAVRTGPYEYLVAGGQKALLWPGSAAYASPPKWLLASEVVETSRRYLRTVARINPGWIEPLAAHLVEREHRDPHWDPGVGAAMAVERISLFGLTIVRQRRVRLASVDPAHARELFIEHGLVKGGYQTRAKFLSANQQLLADLERWQRKVRRHGLLRGEHARFAFYNRRLPDDVYDGQSFERWHREAERREPGLLFMSTSDLLTEPEAFRTDAGFPEALLMKHLRLPLDYCFEPGTEHDGITATVPKEAFHEIEPRRFEWLVPGLLEEKVAALIKSLPKTVRRAFVPVPDTTKRVVGELRFGEGDLLAATAHLLTRIAGDPIRPDDFRLSQLPAHLRLRLRVVDASGRAVAVGRDLAAVRRQLRAEMPALANEQFDHSPVVAGTLRAPSLPTEDADPKYHRTGLTTWDFDDLPEQVQSCCKGIARTRYPALVDCGDSVSLRLTDSLETAGHQTRGGVRRLLALAVRDQVEPHLAWWPGWSKLLASGAPLGDAAYWNREVTDAIVERAFLAERPAPRSRQQFEQTLAEGREQIGLVVQDVLPLVSALLREYGRARDALGQFTSPQFGYAVSDIERQLGELMAPGFLCAAPPAIQSYPRYFRAIERRLDGLRAGELEHDQRAFAQIDARWHAYLALAAQHRADETFDPKLAEYRWLLEEFRVSLFAPQLGTPTQVSAQQLDELWKAIEAY
ncbi:MAG TPA: ATP-dependent RNA helicase HrpA [Pirellulales bacterium]|nr:ATP-dependent RNA helicase HrpA [Pirellulales bacterium]